MSRLNNAALWAACLSAFLPFAAKAQARDASEVIVDRIHSPVPLYTFDWEEFWPRGFSSGDEFGCTSRVAFGDWQFVPTPTNEYEESHWQRFSNYGVFIARRSSEAQMIALILKMLALNMASS